jgi:hypothetical protein
VIERSGTVGVLLKEVKSVEVILPDKDGVPTTGRVDLPAGTMVKVSGTTDIPVGANVKVPKALEKMEK